MVANAPSFTLEDVSECADQNRASIDRLIMGDSDEEVMAWAVRVSDGVILPSEFKTSLSLASCALVAALERRLQKRAASTQPAKAE